MRFILASESTICVALLVRGRAAALARVAALRHDGYPEVSAGAHDRGHLIRAAGTNDGKRASVISATPVGHVRRDVGRIGQDLLASHGRVEPRPQDCANVHHEGR